jgi:hypothetical protein
MKDLEAKRSPLVNEPEASDRQPAAFPPENDALVDLTETTRAKAERLGHDLEPWTPPPGEEAIARRTTCRRCGERLYVRAEVGLLGMAGRAGSERCER